MLNVGLRILLGASLAAGLMACSKQNKKPSLSSTRRGQAQGAEWAKAAIGEGQAGCLKIDVLAGLIRNMNAELISIHTSDLEFVTKHEATGRPVTEAERKQGRTQAVRYNFPRIEGISDILKANYFLAKEKYQPIAETLPGNQINTSKQVGELLAVSTQTGCQAVSFTGTQGAGLIIEAGKRSLKVQIGDEIRSYMLFGRDQVMVSVVRSAGNIPRCDTANMLAVNSLVRRTYMVGKSSSRERYQVSKSLAQLYYSFIYASPELLDRPRANQPATPAQKPADPRSRDGRNMTERLDYMPLSGTTLAYIAGALDSKGGLPDLTCSTTPAARQ